MYILIIFGIHVEKLLVNNQIRQSVYVNFVFYFEKVPWDYVLRVKQVRDALMRRKVMWRRRRANDDVELIKGCVRNRTKNSSIIYCTFYTQIKPQSFGGWRQLPLFHRSSKRCRFFPTSATLSLALPIVFDSEITS